MIAIIKYILIIGRRHFRTLQDISGYLAIPFLKTKLKVYYSTGIVQTT